MRVRVVVAGLLQAGLLACGQAAAPVLSEKDEGVANEARQVATDAAKAGSTLGLVAAVRPDAAPASPEELPAYVTSPDPATGMIIRTGNASIEVDSLDSGLGALRQLARRVGGYVANSAIQGGKEQLRTATIEIKVPAERFEDLTYRPGAAGQDSSSSTYRPQDVGEEFVDLSARVANGRRLEERLIDLLATRTGKLQDVLTVERELGAGAGGDRADGGPDALPQEPLRGQLALGQSARAPADRGRQLRVTASWARHSSGPGATSWRCWRA